MDFIYNKVIDITKNREIYEAGDEINSIGFIVEGSVAYTADSMANLTGRSDILYKSGDFFGYEDLYMGFYSGTYEASSNCRIIFLSCTDCDELSETLSSNGAILDSYQIGHGLCIMLDKFLKMYILFYQDVNSFYTTIYNSYKQYIDLCTQNFLSPETFKMPSSAETYAPKSLPIFDSINHILAAKDSPNSVIIENISCLLTYFEDLLFYLKTIGSSLLSRDSSCLFSLVANLSANLGNDTTSTYMLFDYMKDNTLKIEEKLRSHLGIELNIDTGRINFYLSLASSSIASDDSSMVVLDSMVESTDNITDIYERLTDYCSYPAENTSQFKTYLDQYKKLKDKSSTEDEARVLRRNLSQSFYQLYTKVFLTYAATGKAEKYVELFLDFGLLDEDLLSPEMVRFISNLEYRSGGTPSTIYYLKDWLMTIYKGENVPSKNEFDEEYVDYIRKQKKERNLTPNEENELLSNPEIKVSYEINNLFRYNHRILGGAPSTFVPMLTASEGDRSLKALFLDDTKINAAIDEYHRIDYSIFYRESMYENIPAGISKELIAKEVFPHIILLPCIGVNGVMWQEICGKRINNPGRFVLPAFFAGDLSLTILKLFGRFRWELCKTAHGLSWNDVTIPSLTSEYCDYVQFYKKNHDLSPEKKEALKNVLTRCRNNIRDVFVIDYCQWIKNEANGAMRLNKLSRRILATYCPFSKHIREGLSSNPSFAEAMTKYNLNRAKKLKEISNRYGALERKGIALSDELIITRDFYTEM